MSLKHNFYRIIFIDIFCLRIRGRISQFQSVSSYLCTWVCFKNKSEYWTRLWIMGSRCCKTSSPPEDGIQMDAMVSRMTKLFLKSTTMSIIHTYWHWQNAECIDVVRWLKFLLFFQGRPETGAVVDAETGEAGTAARETVRLHFIATFYWLWLSKLCEQLLSFKPKC